MKQAWIRAASVTEALEKTRSSRRNLGYKKVAFRLSEPRVPAPFPEDCL